MSLFAIADTHLSFASNKPMDDFEGWLNYTDRLKENWNKIIDDKDYVVIAGDISWAMNFDELKADFDYINQLNGKKIILKGNHDYWWNTMSKMNKFIEENNFNTISILHNNAFDFDDFSEALPCYICILAMPFFYSISEGISMGVISYVILNLMTGKAKEKKISALMYVLTVLFILKYVFL